MKTAKEYHADLQHGRNRPIPLCYASVHDIAAIQADALRHAAERCTRNSVFYTASQLRMEADRIEKDSA